MLPAPRPARTPTQPSAGSSKPASSVCAPGWLHAAPLLAFCMAPASSAAKDSCAVTGSCAFEIQGVDATARNEAAGCAPVPIGGKEFAIGAAAGAVVMDCATEKAESAALD